MSTAPDSPLRVGAPGQFPEPPFAVEVNADNFASAVMEASQRVPVVVDFWAPWCAPCRSLKPILEKLAEAFQGRFILAKVNSDENQALAAQFGVRGIPSVKAVFHGEIIDEFSGALPESAVREFLARILPSPAEALREQAAAQRAAGDLAGALQTLGEASRLDTGNEAVRIDAAEILMDRNELDEVQNLLASLSVTAREESRAQTLQARLDIARSGEVGADENSLRARIAARPDDMQARFDLANLLMATGRHEAGLENLLEMVRIDRHWNDAAARKHMLTAFNLLADSPLVATFRRRLASALN